jgi:hydroxyacid-oxoacid transhydrogenase
MAEAMGADVGGASVDDAGDMLASRVVDLLRAVDMPNGLAALGYSERDVDALVEGTLPQHRVTKLSPRPVDADALRALFRASMRLW